MENTTQPQYFPCYICGKPTSAQPLEKYGNLFYYCEECRPGETIGDAEENNEHLNRIMNVPLPIEIEIIKDTIYLPTKEEFEVFYTELNTHGMSLIETGDGTVTITTGAGSKAVFGIRGIANLVADKLNEPIPINADQEIGLAGKPNFIENIDALLQNRMDWLTIEFRNIFELNDHRLEKLCQDYHKIHSIPIIALAEYLRWEQMYTGHRMHTETVRIQEKKAIEIREIRNEYKKKQDEDTVKFIKRAELAENNLKKLKQAYDRNMKLYDDVKSEKDSQKGELEDLHRKFTETNAKNSRLGEDLRTTRAELEKLREKVKKTEVDEWSIDFTSTNDKPAFCNEATDEVITFPCSIVEFNKNYKLLRERTEDGKRKLKKEGSEEYFEIPVSLAKAIPTLMKEEQGEKEEKTGKAKAKISLSANDQRVLDAILSSDEPLSADEIYEITGIEPKHVSNRHINRLKIKGYEIKEINKEGKSLYFIEGGTQNVK